MYAISLWQPWASLMWYGKKKIETRSWKPHSTGIVLAIHAAKKWSHEQMEIANQPRFRNALSDLPSPFLRFPDNIPRGCFGGLVWLERYFQTENETPDQREDEFYFGDYSPGRFGWVCPRVWPLARIVDARGYQKIWLLSSGDAGSIVLAMNADVREDMFSFLETNLK